MECYCQREEVIERLTELDLLLEILNLTVWATAQGNGSYFRGELVIKDWSQLSG
jgi:hypothetical protein